MLTAARACNVACHAKLVGCNAVNSGHRTSKLAPNHACPTEILLDNLRTSAESGDADAVESEDKSFIGLSLRDAHHLANAESALTTRPVMQVDHAAMIATLG